MTISDPNASIAAPLIPLTKAAKLMPLSRTPGGRISAKTIWREEGSSDCRKIIFGAGSRLRI
jgi:hypothetical protein